MHVIILQRNMWYFYFGKLHLAYRFILVFRNSFFYFARRVGILNVDRQAGWNISNNGLVRKLQLLISGIPAVRGAQKPNVDMWSSHKWCLNCLKLHKSVVQHILVVLNCVVFHQIKEGHRWPGSFEVLVHRSHSHYRGINKNSLSKICIYYLFPPPALKNCTVGIYNLFFFAIYMISKSTTKHKHVQIPLSLSCYCSCKSMLIVLLIFLCTCQKRFRHASRK